MLKAGRFTVTAAVATFLALAAATQAERAQPDASNVNVTVKYTGKGAVDADHKIWVWLFDTPEIGPAAQPIAEEAMSKNGGTISFGNVAAKTVYVAVAYDEKGGFTGQAPPPPGSPIAIYGAKGPDGTAQPVTPGAKASVTITFSDAVRMQ